MQRAVFSRTSPSQQNEFSTRKAMKNHSTSVKNKEKSCRPKMMTVLVIMKMLMMIMMMMIAVMVVLMKTSHTALF